jgi:hypothetical protein
MVQSFGVSLRTLQTTDRKVKPVAGDSVVRVQRKTDQQFSFGDIPLFAKHGRQSVHLVRQRLGSGAGKETLCGPV